MIILLLFVHDVKNLHLRPVRTIPQTHVVRYPHYVFESQMNVLLSRQEDLWNASRAGIELVDFWTRSLARHMFRESRVYEERQLYLHFYPTRDPNVRNSLLFWR